MLAKINHTSLNRRIVKGLLFFALLGFTPAWSETSFTIPAQYGEIIHQWDQRSPNQLFIIGIGHRDTLTRANGNNTPRVQAEVYKIGEWLIHHQEVGLLLPEGFFKSPTTRMDPLAMKTPENGISCAKPTDLPALQERLVDPGTFVNAEMLLKADHPLRTAQVEDLGLYMEVREGLLKLVNNRTPSCDIPLLRSELDYLQERRTATMLQNIPGIIDQEFRQGTIRHKKAIFTIGIAHLRDIIKYIDAQEITIHPPPSAPGDRADYHAELRLPKDNFGVSIIIPRTLAKDQRLLEINRLDKIVEESRRQTALRASPPLNGAPIPVP
jgi:hypothetical protein